MNCRQAHEWLNLWIDNLLSEKQQVQLQQHLDACSPCRQIAKRWLQAHEALRHYPSISPRADFDLRVWQAIAQRQPLLRTSSPAFRFAASAAMGVFIMITLLAVMWWHTPRTPEPAPVPWLGGSAAREWVPLLLGTEGGDQQWQEDSSSRSLLPFYQRWRSS